jgi:hypothetical protein
MDLGRCIRAHHVDFFARNACGCVEKEPEMAGDLAFPKTAAHWACRKLGDGGNSR